MGSHSYVELARLQQVRHRELFELLGKIVPRQAVLYAFTLGCSMHARAGNHGLDHHDGDTSVLSPHLPQVRVDRSEE